MPPEIDHQSLVSELGQLSHPRRKIAQWVKNGDLIRLKKGLYLINQEITGRPASLFIAANLLYGPSYISLESALSFHSLIPERVEVMTSVTTGKKKSFETPVALFTYEHLRPKLYIWGKSFFKQQDNRTFLIATPLKALLDYFYLRLGDHDYDIEELLFEDLRLERSELKEHLEKKQLQEVREFYQNIKRCKELIDYLLKEVL